MQLPKILSLSNPELMRRQDLQEQIRECMIDALADDSHMDKLLELALNAMSLLFVFNRDYRRNIDKFQATYVFKSEDGKVDVSVVFKQSGFWRKARMEVKSSTEQSSDIEACFSDARSMAEFVLSENPDVFAGILENKLQLKGNLNYMMKFAYLVRHIPGLLGVQPLPCQTQRH